MSNVSLSDILTAIKNLVTATNTESQTEINLNGAQPFYNLTSATMVKNAAGRIVDISVIAIE